MRYDKQLLRFLKVFLIAMVLTGCGAKPYSVLPEPVQYDTRGKKIDLNIDLYLSDEFRNTKWESSGEHFTSEIYFGNAFVYNSEEMANRLFSNVVVTNTPKNSSKSVDATLIPEIQSINMPWVRGKGNVTVITAILEWTLKDSNGNIIWIDTVKGEGRSKGGSKVKATSVRVKALIQDVFRKSYQTISSSSVIREFTEAH